MFKKKLCWGGFEWVRVGWGVLWWGGLGGGVGCGGLGWGVVGWGGVGSILIINNPSSILLFKKVKLESFKFTCMLNLRLLEMANGSRNFFSENFLVRKKKIVDNFGHPQT